MRFISLFAGIGGLDLGLERAGMECVAQVEIDEFCQKVLQKNFPNVPKFKDVRNVGKHNLPTADLICGGFPCQPHSYSGKRKASADDRDLWREFARVVSEVKPRWIVAENVPGLLTSENGRFFGGILKDLASCGYDAEWHIIPAAAFGAPHIRERIFIVANNTGRGERGLPISTWRSQQKSVDPDGVHKNTAYANSAGLERSNRLQRSIRFAAGTWAGNWIEIATRLCRMDDGISRGMDRNNRLRALGNAVVPQVAEFIGRCIMEQS